MTEEITPDPIAVEFTKPGKFSLIERLQGRNMPTDTVTLYLDEGAAYERRLILEELDGPKSRRSTALLADLEAKLAEVEARIRESAVVIHLRGISSERYDELLDLARESFPIKYEEFTSPLTGQKTRTEIESEERDNLFTALYLSAVIEKAVAGGEEDADITPEWYEQFKRFIPLDGLRMVIEAAYKMRMTVQWMDEIQDEDFSPRP
jgi:hypothetical protein